MNDRELPRLYLVLTADPAADDLAGRLEAALSGGDVACVLFENPGDLPTRTYQQLIAPAVRIAQAAGAAAMAHRDSQAAARLGADGVHLDADPEAVRDACASLQPDTIVGCGPVDTRHRAMELGEIGPDYLLFGRLDRDDQQEAHRKPLALGGWWAELFSTPAVVMAGRDLASVREVAATGAEFVGLKSAVWSHPGGPGAAVAEALRIISEVAEAPA